MSRYLEMLSLFGVEGAHPGGLAFSKAVLQKAAPSPNQPILDLRMRNRTNGGLFRTFAVSCNSR